MKLEKEGPGIKITQSDSETIKIPAASSGVLKAKQGTAASGGVLNRSFAIKVVEGGSAARVIGAIILLGGTLLAWSSDGKIMDMSFIFGVLLMLFGAAVATQRYVMTLNRLHGTWSYGGDVFFMISFKSRGSLTTLGPVRIRKVAINPRDDHMGEPIITYPVSIEARNINGDKEELRFGQHWSLDEAYKISALLAEFLDKSVLDESNKE